MKRPWQVWLVFGACVVAAAVAMGGLTRQALEADRLRRAAVAEAELEQRVSLALWRMDTELAPLVAAEIVRAPEEFRAANWAANRPLPGEQASQQAELQQQVPQGLSPMQLLPLPNIDPPPFVLMQFEARPDGTWTSPQFAGPSIPNSAQQSQSPSPLAELSRNVNLQQLLASLPSEAIPSLADVGDNLMAQNSAKSPAEYNELAGRINFFEGNRSDEAEEPLTNSKPVSKAEQAYKGKAVDLQQRGQRYQTAAQQSLLNQQQSRQQASQFYEEQIANDPFDHQEAIPAEEQVGVTRPIWIGDQLVLARRVGFDGATAVQGCVLDWAALKTRLLAEATDLPNANLLPVRDDASVDPGRMLAGLPVRLVVGPAMVVADASPTLRWSLGMAWGGIALATLAAAALLAGVMTLSERRAAFVSSVTHELRTPLTTFRMYSEMLARNMVPDAARRQEYLHTLQREAERLTLLVENVLAYARLERGRKPIAVDRVTVGGLLERVGPRLSHRASQADMECEFEIAPDVEKCELTTDQNVVEQILFNLVDNAAKYARQATDRRIHVAATRDGNWLRLTVRDHGPGIEHSRWSGQMRAFGKSAEQSAESAPGVGLGLALCRRLAKQLGGRLEILDYEGGGAKVALLLPI